MLHRFTRVQKVIVAFLTIALIILSIIAIRINQPFYTGKLIVNEPTPNVTEEVTVEPTETFIEEVDFENIFIDVQVTPQGEVCIMREDQSNIEGSTIYPFYVIGLDGETVFTSEPNQLVMDFDCETANAIIWDFNSPSILMKNWELGTTTELVNLDNNIYQAFASIDHVQLTFLLGYSYFDGDEFVTEVFVSDIYTQTMRRDIPYAIHQTQMISFNNHLVTFEDLNSEIVIYDSIDEWESFRGNRSEFEQIRPDATNVPSTDIHLNEYQWDSDTGLFAGITYSDDDNFAKFYIGYVDEEVTQAAYFPEIEFLAYNRYLSSYTVSENAVYIIVEDTVYRVTMEGKDLIWEDITPNLVALPIIGPAR